MSHHYIETVKTLQGENIVLRAVNCTEPWSSKTEVDIWGQLNGEGNPIFPPRFCTKSLDEFGSVENYLNSPRRELFHCCSLGQFLAFKIRALNYFEAANSPPYIVH